MQSARSKFQTHFYCAHPQIQIFRDYFLLIMYSQLPSGSTPVHHRVRASAGNGLGSSSYQTSSATPYGNTPANGNSYDYYTNNTNTTPLPAATLFERGVETSTKTSGSGSLPLFPANYRVAALYLPCFCAIFGRPESAIPLKSFFVTMLIVYGLDLANLTSASAFVVWASCLIQTFLTIGCGFFGQDDDDKSMGPFERLVDSFMIAFFYVANACWVSLQSQKAQPYAVPLESTLFGILPLVFATMFVRLTFELFPSIPLWFAFMMSMFLAMLSVGKSSFGNTFAIRRGVAKTHAAVLMFVPAISQVNTSSMYDYILAYSLPFLLFLAAPMTRDSPYIKLRTPRQQWMPYLAALLASIAFQQRYWIPFVHHWSMKILGEHASGLTLYLTLGTVAMMATAWLWNKPNVMGQYHEDVIQVLLALAGVGFGKGSGLTWSMTPLPVLALLGLALWATTRMLRYLSIVMFVIHSASVVIFTYKYLGIDQRLVLPWGYEVPLVRFGMALAVLSIIIGTVMGLVVRPSGGFMAKTLLKFDMIGLLLFAYSSLLTIFEVTLYRQPLPRREMTGFMSEEDELPDGTLYGPHLALFTSFMLVFLVVLQQRATPSMTWASSVVVAIAVGKAVAFWVDSNNEFQKNDSKGLKLLIRVVLGSMLCAALALPCSFLRPVHMKTSGRHRGSKNREIPEGSHLPIVVYCLVLLPISIFAAIPDVLVPTVNALLSNYRKDAYYLVSTPVSELFGGMISLWGLGSVIMLNHYLPDGGADLWKKIGALAFILGLALMVAAPSIGLSIRPISHNPYASMSSLGSQLIKRSISRTGIFGCLVAGAATLLALAGPLQLSEKRNTPGRKDRFLLLRSMIFSMMFGGGVAWFVTIQNMGEAHLLLLAMTMSSTLAISFLGTITGVLGHFIDHEDFEEVVQFSKLWLISFAIFLPVAGLSQFLPASTGIHAFGTGGWCTTYLIVSSISSLGVAVLLRLRSSRNITTRSIANAATVTSWVCFVTSAIGSFGIGGMETGDGPSRFLRIPSCVIWIALSSMALLVLEGENFPAKGGPTRTQLQSGMRTKARSQGLSLSLLTVSNRWFPLFFGNITVLLCMSFYAIFLRGCKLLSGSLIGSSKNAIMAKILATAFSAEGGPMEVYKLVDSVVKQTNVQTLESHLDAVSFWISDGPFRPILHVAGALAVMPCLYRLREEYWKGKHVPSNEVLLSLPFAAAPFVLCSLPTIRIASATVTVLSIRQLLTIRATEHRNHLT